MTYNRSLAGFLLGVFLWGLLTPGIVMLWPSSVWAQAVSPNAQTASPGVAETTYGEGETGLGGGGIGGLSRLFQGPVGMFLMILLLSRLLQSLFGGGGATPQRGPAEEQPPRQPALGPRQTGPRQPAQPGIAGGLPERQVLENPALFIHEDRIYPDTLAVRRADADVTVYNTNQDARTVRVFGPGDDRPDVEPSIPGTGLHVLRFTETGDHRLFISETLESTVTVQP